MRTPLLVAATSCLALAIGAANFAAAQTSPQPSPTQPSAPQAQPDRDRSAPGGTSGSMGTTSPRAPTASTTPAAGPVGTLGVATLVGTDVKNSAGDNIGEIKDVIVDNSGKATSVILGTGGVLGLGERNVPISWDQMKIARDENGKMTASTALTKEQIEGMPEYTKDKGAWRAK